jgi:hypothetical protein
MARWLEMADVLTTSREEIFLQTYFNGLAQSSFDKCKDAVVCDSFCIIIETNVFV